MPRIILLLFCRRLRSESVREVPLRTLRLCGSKCRSQSLRLNVTESAAPLACTLNDTTHQPRMLNFMPETR